MTRIGILLGVMAAMSLGYAASPRAGRSPSNLVGEWHFSEGMGNSAGDSSGSGFSGTLTGGAAWTTGRTGTGVSLSGKAYVNLGANLPILESASAASVSIWIKPSSTIPSGSTRELVSFAVGSGAATDTSRLALALQGNGTGGQVYLGARSTDTETEKHVATSTNVTLGTWTHIAGVVDYAGNTLLIYINGTLSVAAKAVGFASASTPNTPSRNCCLGAAAAGDANFFLGALDEVQVYKRALSATEIATLAQGDALAARWSFDEGSGTTANDATGNGYTGTLTNGATFTSAGEIAGAVTLDGVKGYVNLGSNLNILRNVNAASVSGWVKPASVIPTGSSRELVSISVNAASPTDVSRVAVALQGDGTTGGLLYAEGRSTDTETKKSLVATTGLPLGVWSHIAAVIDFSGMAITLYINGEPAGTAAAPFMRSYTPNTPTTSAALGAEDTGDANWFAGSLDEVRIYGRPLSRSDVEALALQPGLDGMWKFDESSGTTTADSSGHGFTGTLKNGATFVPGKLGNAVSLNGTNQYVSLGTQLPILNGVRAATVTSWVNLSSQPASGACHDVVSLSVNNGTTLTDTTRMVLSVRGNGTTSDIFAGARSLDTEAQQTAIGTASLGTGTWYHLAMVVDYGANTIKVYKNGTLLTTQGVAFAQPSTPNTNSTDAALGAKATGDGNWFAGLMDETRVYSRALSDAEIQALAGAVLPAAPTNLVATAGDTMVTLTWTAASGATSYNIYERLDPGAYSSPITSTSATTVQIPGLLDGQKYFFKVTGVSPAGEGPASAEQSATPAPQGTPPPPPAILTPPQSTNNPLMPIVGTAAPNVMITILYNGVPDPMTAGSNFQGNWLLTPSSPKTDGFYSVTATASNSFGTSGPSNPVAILVDTVSPAITNPSPANNSTVFSATPPISASWSDGGSGLNLSTAVITLDGAPVSSATLTATGFSFTPSPLIQGTHTVIAKIQDQAGNTGSLTWGFSVLLAPNAPTITQPTPNALFATGFPTISGNSSGGGLTITVFIETGAIGMTTSAPDGTWTLIPPPSMPIPDGLHTLTAIATNPAGSSPASSPGVPITIDTMPPVIGNPSPANGATVFTATPTVSASWSDTGSGIVPTSGVVYLDSVAVSGAGITPTGFSFTPTLSAGPHTIAATVMDVAGNVGSLTWSFTVVLPPPAPTITAPGTGAILATGVPTISGTSSSSGLTIALFVDGAARGTTTSGTGGAWSLAPNAVIADGTHTLTATASNGAASPASAGILITVDTVPPVISNPSPADGATVTTGSPTVSASWSDGGTGVVPSSAVLLLDGITVAGATLTPAGFSFTTTNLSAGTHTVSSKVQDQAGNTGSLSWSFTVLLPPTAPAISTPTSGAILATGLPTVTGTSSASGLTITLLIDGVAQGTTTSVAGGQWSLAPTVAIPDGGHTLTATAANTAGTSPASHGVSVTIDTTPPVISNPSPANGSTISTTAPTVSASWSDAGTGVAPNSAVISLDGIAVPVTGVTLTATGFSFTTTNLSAGTHTVSSQVKDQVGNVGSLSWSFTVLLPPPVPSISTPATGAILATGVPTVSGTSSASGLTITLLVDGVARGTTTTISGGGWSLPPNATILDGSRTLTATATNAAGTSPASAGVSITIDTVAPVISNPSPASGATVTTATPTISASWSDAGTGVVLSTASVTLDGGTVTNPGVTSTGFAFSPTLAAGNHTVSAQIKDAAGNTGTLSWSFTVVLPPSAPTITSPTAGAFLSSGTPTITGTSSASGLTITLLVDGASKGTATTGSGGNWSLTPSSAMADGTHTLTATASNSAGTSPASPGISITVDTIPPTISNLNPANGTSTPNRRPTISASWSDPNLAPSTGTIKLDSSDVTLTATLSATGVTFLPTSDLAAGAHTVVVSVKDAAGNTGTASWSFTVVTGTDTTPPTLTLTPADGTLTTTQTPVLTASYSDASGINTASFKAILDGTDVTALFTVSPTQATLTPSAPLADGFHTLAIQIADTVGNVAQASSVFREVSAFGTIVAAGGGTLQVTDPARALFGASIAVPNGAIPADTFFVIAQAPLPGGFPTAFAAVGPAAEVDPSGTLFSPQATLSLPYVPALLPNGVAVRLLHFDPGSRTWSEITGISTDTTNHLAVAPLSDLVGNIYVPVVQTTDPSTSTLLAVPSTLPADGITLSVLTVTPRDSLGNPAGPGHTIQLEIVSGTGLLSSVTDQGDGTYQGTLTSTVAGNVVVQALDGGLALDMLSTVTFYAPETVPTTLEISGLTNPLVAGQAGDITLIARDSHGFIMKLFQGDVQLTLSGTQDAFGNQLFPSQFTRTFTDLGEGVLVLPALLRAARAGQATVGATLVGQTTPAASATLTVTPAAPSLLLKVSGDNQSVLPGVTLPAPFTTQVTDPFGNGVGGVTVQYQTTQGGGSFGGPSSVLSDPSGMAASPAYTVGTAFEVELIQATLPAVGAAPVVFTAFSTRAAPTVTSPSSGSSVNGPSFTVTGTAPAGFTVDVYVGGVLVGGATAAADGTFSVPVTTKPGSVAFTLVSVDPNGLVSLPTNPITIQLSDVVGPDVVAYANQSLLSATQQSFSNQATPVFKFQYTDISGVDETSLVVTLNGTNITSQLTRSPGLATFQVPAVQALLEVGNTLSIQVKDLLGNLTTLSYSIALDLTPPGIRIVPKNASLVRTLTPTIQLTFKDPATLTTGSPPVQVPGSGVDPASVRIVIDSIDYTSQATITDTIATLQIPAVAPLFTGFHEILVTCSDRAGNPARRLGTFTVDPSAPPDQTPPQVSIDYPFLSNAISGTTLPIAVTATDNESVASVQLLVNGSPFGPPLTQEPYTFTYPLPAVDGTQVTLTAQATDPTGNVGTSFPIFITTVSSTATATVRFEVTAPDVLTAGQPFTAVIRAVAQDGSTDTQVVGTVAVGTTDQNSAFAFDPFVQVTFALSDHGQKVVNLPPLVTAGYQTVWAHEYLGGPGPIGGAKTGILVLPADLNNIQVAPVEPQHYQAGRLLRFTATAFDAYNNIIPDVVFDITTIETDAQGNQFQTTYNPLTGSPADFAVTTRPQAIHIRLTVAAGGRQDIPAAVFTKDLAGSFAVNISLETNVAVAGQPVTFTVVITDENGLVERNFTGTVYIVYDPKGDKNYQNLAVTFTSSDQGIVSVTSGIIIQKWGLAFLVGTSVPPGPNFDPETSNGASDDLTILPAKPSSWSIQANDPQYVGDDLNALASVQDAFGNPAIHAPIQITLEKGAGGGGSGGSPLYELDTQTNLNGFYTTTAPQLTPDLQDQQVTVNLLDPTTGTSPTLMNSATLTVRAQPFSDGLSPTLNGQPAVISVKEANTIPNLSIQLNVPFLSATNGIMDFPLQFNVSLEGGGQFNDLDGNMNWFGFTNADASVLQGTVQARFTGLTNDNVPVDDTVPLDIKIAFVQLSGVDQKNLIQVTITNQQLLLDELGDPVDSGDLTIQTGLTGPLGPIVLKLTVDVPKAPEVFEALPSSRVMIDVGQNRVESAFLEGSYAPRITAFRDIEDFFRPFQPTQDDYHQDFFMEIRSHKDDIPTPTGQTNPAIEGVSIDAGTGTDSNFQTIMQNGQQKPGTFLHDLTFTQVQKHVFRSPNLAIIERPMTAPRAPQPTTPGVNLGIESPVRSNGTDIARAIATVVDQDLRPVPNVQVVFTATGSNSGKVKFVKPEDSTQTASQTATTDSQGQAVIGLTSTTADTYQIQASSQQTTETMPVLFIDAPLTIQAAFGGTLMLTTPPAADLFDTPSNDNLTESLAYTGTHGVHVALQSVGDTAFIEAPSVVKGNYRRFQSSFEPPQEAIAPVALRFIYSNIKVFGKDYDNDGLIAPEELDQPEMDISDGLPESAGPARNRIHPGILNFILNNPGSDSTIKFPVTKTDKDGNTYKTDTANNHFDWIVTDEYLNLADPSILGKVPAFFVGPNRIRLVFRDYYGFSNPTLYSTRIVTFSDQTPAVGTQFESWDQTSQGTQGEPGFLDRFELFFPVNASLSSISDFLKANDLQPVAFDSRTGRVTVISANRNLNVTDFQSLQAQLNQGSGGQVAYYLPEQLELYRTNLAGTVRYPSVQEAPRGTTPFGGAAGTVNLHNGEFVMVHEDLRIPGIGMDWHHTRTYRSQIAYDGPQGQSWDFNYNIRLGEHYPNDVVTSPSQGGDPQIYNPGGNTARNGDVVLFDGTGRRDVYIYDVALGAYYSPAGRYDTLTKRPAGAPLTDPAYTIVDRHQTTFKFVIPSDQKKYPEIDLNAGRNELADRDALTTMAYISQIVDRNGNTMNFRYNEGARNPSNMNRLTSVIDTTGREIDYTYNPDGTLQMIQAYAGTSATGQNGSRTLQFQYYSNGDAGGQARDLSVAIGPPVSGTSTGNDFPQGKKTSYTYFTGGFPSLQHNLLTVTDGEGNKNGVDTTGAHSIIRNTFGTDPLALDYDCVTQQGYGRTDNPDNIPHFTDTSGTFVFAYNGTTTTVTDRKNHNEDWTFLGSSQNTDPTSFTTATAATPVKHTESVTGIGQVTTTFVHNQDTELTHVIHPLQNELDYQFQSDDRPTAKGSGLARGNMLKETQTPGAQLLSQTAQASLVTEFLYDSTFNFVTRMTRPRGAASGSPASYATQFIPDGNGNVQFIIEPNVALGAELTPQDSMIKTTFFYQAKGQLFQKQLPNGTVDQFGYDANGYLNSITHDQNGWKLTTGMTNDAVGNVINTTDPRGVKSVFEVNALNQVVATTLAAPGGTLTIAGQLTNTFYDANNNVVRVQQMNDLPAVVQQLGPNATYDQVFMSSQGMGGASHLTIHTYDGLSQVLSTQQTSGGGSVTTSFQYDPNENRVLVVTPRGASNYIKTDYNELNLPTTVNRSNLYLITLGYDANGNRTGSTTTYGTTRTDYDGYDRSIRVTDPEGTVATMDYDADGNLRQTKVNGSDGHGLVSLLRSTVLFYDNLDRLYATAQEMLDARAQSKTDPSSVGGKPDDFSPDPYVGQVAITKRALDSMGRVRKLINDNGNSVTRMFDTAGRLTEEDAAGGFKRIYTPDNNGNVTSIQIMDNVDHANPIQQMFDALNRRIQTTDPRGNVTTFAYDARGSLVSMVTGKGNRTNYYTDYLGRSVRTQTLLGFGVNQGVGTAVGSFDDLSQVTQYDDNSNVVSQTVLTKPSGLVAPVTYDYNDADQRTVTHYGGTTFPTTDSFTLYDGAGNPHGFTDRRGVVFAINYDLLGRPIQFSASNLTPDMAGSTVRTMTWDGLGRLASSEDDNAGNPQKAELYYNGLGKVIADRQSHEGSNHVGPASYQVQTVYDGVGNKVETYYPATKKTFFRNYDGNEQLDNIPSADPQNPYVKYTYEGMGRISTRTYANGISKSLRYDGNLLPIDTQYKSNGNTLLRILSEDPVTSEIGYDQELHLTFQTVTNNLLAKPSTYTETYSYDAAGRLTDTERTQLGALRPASSSLYDDAGNVTDGFSFSNYSVVNGSIYPVETHRTRTPDLLNRYMSENIGRSVYANVPNLIFFNKLDKVQVENRTANFGYDAAGNLTDTEDLKIHYDAFGRPAVIDQKKRIGQIFDPSQDVVQIGRTNAWNLFEKRNNLDLADGMSLTLYYGQNNQTFSVSYPVLSSTDKKLTFQVPDGQVSPFDSSSGRFWSLYYVLEYPGSTTPLAQSMATYAYDGLGRRTEKSVRRRGAESGQHDLIYEDMQPIEDRSYTLGSSTSAIINQYLWGAAADEIVRMETLVEQNQQSLYLRYYFDGPDGNVYSAGPTGSTTVENYDTSSEGGVTLRWADGTPQPFFPWTNAIVWHGHYADAETGLLWVRARYYSPQLGRFIQTDGLGAFADSGAHGNPYTYGGNNPKMFSDNGNALNIVAGIIGAVAGAIVGYVNTGTQEGAAIGALEGGLAGLTFGASLAARVAIGTAVSTITGYAAGGAEGARIGFITGFVGSLLAARSGGNTFWSNVFAGSAAGAIVGGIDAALRGESIGRGVALGAEFGGLAEAFNFGVAAVTQRFSAGVGAFGKMELGSGKGRTVGTLSRSPISWRATRALGTRQTYLVYRRNDINWQRIRTAGAKMGRGMTNAEAARRFGLPPQLEDGNFATLHHLGQDSRGPLVEASTRYHGVGKPGQDILHSQYGRSKINPDFPVDRKVFSIDDRQYWQWRSQNQ
jgi:RHS repeat-associated protein